MGLTMKIKEACKFLGVSDYMLRKLCKQGEVPYSKVGSIYLFRQEALIDWLERQEAQNGTKDTYDQTGYGKLRRIKE